jgi:hypothetical protein
MGHCPYTLMAYEYYVALLKLPDRYEYIFKYSSATPLQWLVQAYYISVTVHSEYFSVLQYEAKWLKQ